MGSQNEAHISTLGDEAQAYSRFPGQDENPWRPRRDQGSACQGTCEAGRLRAPAIYSFPRSYRLLKADEFSSVFSFRRAVFGEFFQVQVRPSGREHPRLGMIVPKKTERRAVYRNLAKRIIRECFRTRSGEIGGADVVVRLRKSFRRDRAGEARQELHILISRVAHVPALDRTD